MRFQIPNTSLFDYLLLCNSLINVYDVSFISDYRALLEYSKMELTTLSLPNLFLQISFVQNRCAFQKHSKSNKVNLHSLVKKHPVYAGAAAFDFSVGCKVQ